MKLYSIALPDATNSGRKTLIARATWENRALELSGGFTRRPAGEGSWRDPKSGEIFHDVMHSYEVACGELVWRQLVAAAFELFPDQLAIFTAEIGYASIVERP